MDLHCSRRNTAVHYISLNWLESNNWRGFPSLNVYSGNHEWFEHFCSNLKWTLLWKKNHSWTFTSHALPASFSCNHVNSVLEEAQSSVNNLQPIWLTCVSGWLEMKGCLEDDWKWSHMNWMIEYRIPDGRCWHRAHCTTVVEGERCPVHSFVNFFSKRLPP